MPHRSTSADQISIADVNPTVVAHYGDGIFPIPAQVAPLAGYPGGVGFLFA
jgi:hypothetical protein